ncbi:MAG: phage tail protein [Candidatus Omnitrophica bacterium]|nr:phage tail protein [Candidatus Omnitrophota bacterium]
MNDSEFPSPEVPESFPARMMTVLKCCWFKCCCCSDVPGTVKMLAGTNIPNGWLPCTGGSVPITQYHNLYNAIGTRYGHGDFSHTFKLPNLVARFPRGIGPTPGPGVGAGHDTCAITLNNLPSHSHEIVNLPVTVENTHTHGTDLPSHSHGIVNLPVTVENAHTHGTDLPSHSHEIVSLPATVENAHTHGSGSYTTDDESSHTHGLEGLETGADGGHRHNLQVQSQRTDEGSTFHFAQADSGDLNSFSTDVAGAHTHDISGSTGSGVSHHHLITGNSGAGSEHNHTLSGSTESSVAIPGNSGAGSQHNHTLSGSTESTGGNPLQPINIVPAYTILLFIIKT